jgi:hypothetical protein
MNNMSQQMPMINVGGSNLPPEIMQQQQALNRQQQMAQLLMQQGQSMPSGQMVSGRYVAPSFFQYAAPLFQTYAGKSLAKESDAEAVKLAEKLRKGETEALADFMKIKQGRPAVEGGIYGPDNQLTMQTTPDMIGPQGELTSQYRKVAPVAGVAPNTQSAYANLYADPRATQRLRDMAFAEMTAKPESYTLTEGGVRVQVQPDGTHKIVASGADKTSSDYKDYLLASKDPINPFKGSFVDYQTMIKRAGATSINMPSGEERKAGFMSNILDRNLLQMQTALGVDPTAVKPNVPASIVEAITGPNLLSRNMKPAQRQIVEDSQLDVLDAALTLRTGAAYTREQLNAMRETYFPVLGDKPPAVQAKKQRLESLLEGAYIAAGRAVPARVSAPPPPAPPAPPSVREQLNIPKSNIIKQADEIVSGKK